mmetsp:Transcript_18718/g.54130  ORF Transcript_18718/g.54130 Transcript_18718/m.54130 type:complete len:254 (+) Transcript_18718:400-1161(+)
MRTVGLAAAFRTINWLGFPPRWSQPSHMCIACRSCTEISRARTSSQIVQTSGIQRAALRLRTLGPRSVSGITRSSASGLARRPFGHRRCMRVATISSWTYGRSASPPSFCSRAGCLMKARRTPEPCRRMAKHGSSCSRSLLPATPRGGARGFSGDASRRTRIFGLRHLKSLRTTGCYLGLWRVVARTCTGRARSCRRQHPLRSRWPSSAWVLLPWGASAAWVFAWTSSCAAAMSGWQRRRASPLSAKLPKLMS